MSEWRAVGSCASCGGELEQRTDHLLSDRALFARLRCVACGEWFRLDLTLTPVAEDWRTQAACVGQDPGWFVPDPTQTQRPPHRRDKVRADDIETVKAVCSSCPVRPECLAEGLTGMHTGIWGGTDDYERAQLRKERRRREGWQPQARSIARRKRRQAGAA